MSVLLACEMKTFPLFDRKPKADTNFSLGGKWFGPETISLFAHLCPKKTKKLLDFQLWSGDLRKHFERETDKEKERVVLLCTIEKHQQATITQVDRVRERERRQQKRHSFFQISPLSPFVVHFFFLFKCFSSLVHVSLLLQQNNIKRFISMAAS